MLKKAYTTTLTQTSFTIWNEDLGVFPYSGLARYLKWGHKNAKTLVSLCQSCSLF